jgi:hypothetical protein
MLWVATALLSTALVVPHPVRASPPAAGLQDTHMLSCDDGSMGGTLVQRDDTAYGNRFALGCAGGRLRRASFVHWGSGFAGPYAYRLRVLDAECRQVGVTGLLLAADAAGAPAAADVDLAAFGWCVGAGFVLALEPLTCAEVGDCFPAVAVDASSDGDSRAHCGVVVKLGGGSQECFAPRSADGRYFDFRLRAEVDCADPLCASPVAAGTWTGVKRLYADPEPAR